jgi:hypothetical protein
LGTSEIEMLRRSLDGLRGDLPPSWRWRQKEGATRRGIRFDAVVTLQAPDGQEAILLVEAKRLVARKEVAGLVEQIRSWAAEVPGAVPVVAARYLSRSIRERLEREGVGYVDATGNRRLALERPALFIRNVGADRDPWRGAGRPRGTLKGAPAARVVRWLADVSPPYTLTDVAKGSGASVGATYRVIDFLEGEELVQRERRGPITTVRWRALIERWSRDYGFQRDRRVAGVLFPRGIEALVDRLRSVRDPRCVLTGSLAARRYAAHAPARFAMLYADDPSALIERLDLRHVDTGANVLIAVDQEGIAFARAQKMGGVHVAAPSQIAVDLLTGPGRSPSEGEALLDWMEAHEPEWRS